MVGMRKDTRKAEERDGFRFRGGHHALDLTATLAARLKPTPIERLQQPGDLARWLVAAGLVDSSPAVDATELDQAHRLREAIYVLATAHLDGKDAPSSAREVVNDVAALPAAVPRLGASGSMQLVGSAAALLSSVARSAIELFGGDERSRVKQCASPTCTILFVDRWQTGDRRWCSMAGCGNQAKVRAFRRRASAAELDPTASK